MRREEGAELLFLLLVDRSDQNGHDGYIRADNKESGSDADSSREIALSLPLKDLPDIGQVHLDAVLVLVCLEVHIAELAGPLQFANRYTPKRGVTTAAAAYRLSTHCLGRLEEDREASRTACRSTTRSRPGRRGVKARG